MSNNKTKPAPPQWVIDLNSVNSTSKVPTITAITGSGSKNKHQNQTQPVVDPPGYTPSSSTSHASKKLKNATTSSSSSQSQSSPSPNSIDTQTQTQTQTQTTLYIKKSWETALAPFKALPMNLVMMYMSGNSLQIFSIMMTFMLFMNPIKALSSVNSTFRRFETPETKSTLWLVKLTYVAAQVLSLLIGVWKVNSMGLLPNTRSDWLAWEKERVSREYAATVFAT